MSGLGAWGRDGAGVAFCCASRVALGNLQRVTNVAAALAERRREMPLRLVTNSARGGEWARHAEHFREVLVSGRAEMAGHLAALRPGAVVVSVLEVPGLERLDVPLCLVLREVLPGRLERFRLPGGRPWDLVVVANPADEWLPDRARLPARRVEPVGWIYRRPEPAEARTGAAGPAAERTVLIASGGGSADAEHAALTDELAALVAGLRGAARPPLRVLQARGPHAVSDWAVPGVDDVIEPGPALHQLFARSDLVISTAGYNSVLEIACTDVPALLVPIGRYTDDQHKRARSWGARVGRCHEPAGRADTIRWMVDVLEARSRRPVADPGPSGAPACAALIEQLLA